jgi:alkaline phosphatase
MFRKLRLSVFVLMVLLVTAFAYAQDKAPKHIFMFIGDGMGVAQRQIAELQLNNKPGVTATSQKVRLNMNSLKVLGMNTTYDSTSIVPDSASTATSLASGYKTLSGVIGMKEDKVTKVPLISEFLKQKGLSVGIISDVKIVHATPAAFYAHIDSRNKYDEIASQLIHSGFDLFVGGGGDKHFNPATRKDGKDLYAEAASKGFALARTRDEFLSLKKGT